MNSNQWQVLLAIEQAAQDFQQYCDQSKLLLHGKRQERYFEAQPPHLYLQAKKHDPADVRL